MMNRAQISNADTDGNRRHRRIRYEGALKGFFYAEPWYFTKRANFLANCVTRSIEPDKIVVMTLHAGDKGDRAFVHLKDIGLVRGSISRVIGGVVHMDIETDANQQSKLASSILYLERKYAFDASDKREFPRFKPRDPESILTVDGEETPCQIVDVSPSGAAILSEIRPHIRSRLTLGQVSGQVVRHTDFGFAMAFTQVQDPTTLERNILPLVANRDVMHLHQGNMVS